MNFLPAFYFPTTLICVDDKQFVLDGFKSLFANSFNCKFYQDPDYVQRYFDNYKSPLDQISFLNKIPEFELDQYSTQSVVQLDIAKIIDLAKSKEKYEEISVLLADYYMLPAIDGLELCKSLEDYSVKKMLLTENQTYDTAREALNSGVIDYFANKTDSVGQIEEAVHNLSTNFFCEYTADIINHLYVESASPLKDAVFINYFNKIVKDNNIIEYYLLDKNGSYLLIATNRKKYVLIVHNDTSLSEFTSILDEYDDLMDKSKLIKDRNCIPFFGIGEGISNDNLQALDKHLFDAYTLEGKHRYYLHLLEYDLEL